MALAATENLEQSLYQLKLWLKYSRTRRSTESVILITRLVAVSDNISFDVQI
jgi:hypothetical protein